MCIKLQISYFYLSLRCKVLFMKRCFFFFFLLVTVAVSAFAKEFPYRITADFYSGYILPISKNLELTAKKPIFGGEVAVEFLPRDKYDWEQRWGLPTIGAGFVGLDLGNPSILGQAFAVYPYVLVPIVRTNVFKLNYKVGAGVSFFTKTWNDCDTLNGINSATANSTIGSIANVYLSTGTNMRFELGSGVSMGLEFGYNHMSNGSILQPNGGLNILYGKVGFGFQPKASKYTLPAKVQPKDLPFDMFLDIVASGGVRELYYRDNKRYGIASLHVATAGRLGNFYALGGGLDLFYDGVFVQQGQRGSEIYNQHTHYKRYFIPNENAENKWRCGFFIANYFILGRVTAELDWGFYLYDGVRNANPNPHPKYGYERPMFYTYKINDEDGWNYFRLAFKVRVWEGLTANVALKTHLQKAEFIEFGLGYQIPFLFPKNKK